MALITANMKLISSFLILSFCTVVLGDQYGFSFPNATDPSNANLQFTLGQELTMTWVAPFPSVQVAFIAQDGNVFQFFDKGDTGNSLTWAVNVNNSGSSSSFYYLYFENSANNSQHYYSALFQVVSGVNPLASVTQTIATSTATPTATTTPNPTLQASISVKGSTTVVITQVRTTTTDSSTASSTSSDAKTPTPILVTSGTSSNGGDSGGLSQSAKVGLGVGIPLGVCALVGIAVFITWRNWRRSRAAHGDAPTGGNFATPGPPAMASYADGNGPVGAYNEHAAKLAHGQQGGMGAAGAPPSGSKPFAYAPDDRWQVMDEGQVYEMPSSQSRQANVHEIDDSTPDSGFRDYR